MSHKRNPLSILKCKPRNRVCGLTEKVETKDPSQLEHRKKCGGPELLTGWISTFSIFNEKGELYADMSDFWPTIRLDDIYHNIASCPTKINENGIPKNGTLFVGQMAYDFAIDEEANIPEAVESIKSPDGKMRKLKPRNDWALVISQGYRSRSSTSRSGNKCSTTTGWNQHLWASMRTRRLYPFQWNII